MSKFTLLSPLLVLIAGLYSSVSYAIEMPVFESCKPFAEQWRAGKFEYDKPNFCRSFHFTQDFSGADVVGTGKYRYRLLMDVPSQEKGNVANLPYFIQNDKALMENGNKLRYRGITDAKGRTAVFAFSQPIDPYEFNLGEQRGTGNYGKWFNLVDDGDEPKYKESYAIVVCGNEPYLEKGITSQEGDTVYIATKTPTILKLMYHPNKQLLSANKATLKAICADERTNHEFP